MSSLVNIVSKRFSGILTGIADGLQSENPLKQPFLVLSSALGSADSETSSALLSKLIPQGKNLRQVGELLGRINNCMTGTNTLGIRTLYDEFNPFDFDPQKDILENNQDDEQDSERIEQYLIIKYDISPITTKSELTTFDVFRNFIQKADETDEANIELLAFLKANLFFTTDRDVTLNTDDEQFLDQLLSEEKHSIGEILEKYLNYKETKDDSNVITNEIMSRVINFLNEKAQKDPYVIKYAKEKLCPVNQSH